MERTPQRPMNQSQKDKQGSCDITIQEVVEDTGWLGEAQNKQMMDQIKMLTSLFS